MRFLIFISIFIFIQKSSLAQDEVIQDKDGGIFFVYSENGVRDSIKMITSRSQNLTHFEIQGDDVLFFIESWAYIAWRRYKINKEEKSSYAIFRDAISRGDRAVREAVYYKVENNLDKIHIRDKRTHKDLISVEYKHNENIISIDKKYKNFKENKPLVHSPRAVINKNGEVIRRH